MSWKASCFFLKLKKEKDSLIYFPAKNAKFMHAHKSNFQEKRFGTSTMLVFFFFDTCIKDFLIHQRCCSNDIRIPSIYLNKITLTTQMGYPGRNKSCVYCFNSLIKIFFFFWYTMFIN